MKGPGKTMFLEEADENVLVEMEWTILLQISQHKGNASEEK